MDDKDPPGDWEEPNLVSFLAVPARTGFDFALSLRQTPSADEKPYTDELISLARHWLQQALIWNGAGAKTAAGYGRFAPSSQAGSPVAAGTKSHAYPEIAERLVWETTLELVTPAFLAGANQQAEDCELRPATLRGQLRWWWRTMHAGYLDVATLRQLEGAIWGDTKTGAAISLHLGPMKPAGTSTNPKAFRKNNHRGATSQGLFYVSYGMDEPPKASRFYLEAGRKWELTILARGYSPPKDLKQDGKDKRPPWTLDAPLILAQAKAALALLCRYGGVGSKSRKGFGSLFSADCDSLNDSFCAQEADKIRRAMNANTEFQENWVHSPSLKQMLTMPEKAVKESDVWKALGCLGGAYQDTVKARDKNQRRNFGLPRRADAGRHASPLILKISRKHDGTKVYRATAFPSEKLPDLITGAVFLNDVLGSLGQMLGSSSPATSASTKPGGKYVEVTIIEITPTKIIVQEDGEKEPGELTGNPPPNTKLTLFSRHKVRRIGNNPPKYCW